MELKDKVVVITGASDGLGKQVTLKLASNKTQLALVSRDKKRLKTLKKEVEKITTRKVEIYPVDIRKTKELEKVVGNIISDFYHL